MRRFRYSIAIILGLAAIAMIGVRLGSQPRPAPRTYVGQESCMAANCHEGAYGEASSYQGAEKFRQTIHQKIHLRPTPQTVVADRYFEGDSVVRFIDPSVKIAGRDTIEFHFSKSVDRKDYYIQLKFSGGGDTTQKMKVAYTYGGNGWIERYLVQVEGVYYVAPFQFILPGYKVRTADGGKFYFTDRTRWYYNDVNTTEAFFFKPNDNLFRSRSWDNQCTFCHVNGFDVKLTVNGPDSIWNASWVGVKEKDSALQDQNIKIGCESCHGPGSEHAANPTADNIVSPASFPDTKEGTDLKYDLCDQCHNRISSSKNLHTYPYDDSLNTPYVPGLKLHPFTKSTFGQMSVWGDGITSSAHHQQGQDIVSSDHYTKNIFKNGCWSCHTPHQNGPDGLPYQLDRNWYSLEKGKGCMNNACHPTMADTGFSAIVGRTVNLHTRHSQSISQCVNCHFTKVISIAFDTLPTRPLYEFSDHTFRVIRPIDTRRYAQAGIVGQPNTCAVSCHRNGRGQRNFDPNSPVAPAFDITDSNIYRWKDKADLDLADSLWFHFKRLYPEYVLGVKNPDLTANKLTIASVVPNPASSSTTVQFTLPTRGDVSLEVYDIQGRYIRTIAAGPHAAGGYSAVWDGRDDFGNNAVAGVYMIRLSVGGASTSAKLLLQR